MTARAGDGIPRDHEDEGPAGQFLDDGQLRPRASRMGQTRVAADRVEVQEHPFASLDRHVGDAGLDQCTLGDVAA